jgi:hypothetical protein
MDGLFRQCQANISLEAYLQGRKNGRFAEYRAVL